MESLNNKTDDKQSKNPNSAPPSILSAETFDVAGGLILIVFGTAFHYAGGWFHILAFFFDFLAVCFGLVAITHFVKDERFKLFGKSFWICVVIALLLLGAVAFFVVRKDVFNNGQPEYLDGTTVTYNQLKRFYQFGYTVYYFDGSQQTDYKVFNSNKLEWKMDWANLKIQPDFSREKVLWTFPPINAVGGGITITSPNSNNWPEVRAFRKGFFRLNIPFPENQPAIFGGVLNNDQRNPVFCVGMRIPTRRTKEEINDIFGSQYEFIQAGEYPIDNLPKDLESFGQEHFPLGFQIFRIKNKIWVYEITNKVWSCKQYYVRTAFIIPNFTNQTVAWNIPTEANSTNFNTFTVALAKGVLFLVPTNLYRAKDGKTHKFYVGTIDDKPSNPLFIFGETTQ